MGAEDVLVGHVVGYVMPDGQVRPATVVRVWDKETSAYPPGTVNMTVFTDWGNDRLMTDTDAGLVWRTSVAYDAEKAPGTWHWLEG